MLTVRKRFPGDRVAKIDVDPQESRSYVKRFRCETQMARHYLTY